MDLNTLAPGCTDAADTRSDPFATFASSITCIICFQRILAIPSLTLDIYDVPIILRARAHVLALSVFIHERFDTIPSAPGAPAFSDGRRTICIRMHAEPRPAPEPVVTLSLSIATR